MNVQTFSRDPRKRKTPSACVVSEAVVIVILTLAISLSLSVRLSQKSSRKTAEES